MDSLSKLSHGKYLTLFGFFVNQSLFLRGCPVSTNVCIHIYRGEEK